jgi:hypothetical protein
LECTHVAQSRSMNKFVKEMDKYKIDICALQEIRWPGTGIVIKRNYMILYSAHNWNRILY